MPGLKIKIDVNEAKRASMQLRKEMSALGIEAGKDEKEFKKLEARLHRGMKADKAKRGIDGLKKSLNLTRLETAKMQRQMGDYSGAMQTMTGITGKAAKKMALFTAAMATGAAVAAGLVTKKIVSLGREFETTMKTVQAWSGAAGKSLENLTDIAKKMGAETEYTANQAASALKFLAAAGFTAEQSIGALPGTLDLATAGQVDLARATDITTDVLTAFGMSVGELNRVNDAFITTSSSSNTNVLMLGESFKMVAPTANLFGLSVEQTASLLGVLGNSMIKGEMAGSGLNMALMKSQIAAKELGMELDSSLVDVLKKMNEEQWDAIKIGKAFGVRQVKTVAILMKHIDTYEALNKKIIENQGATSKLAEIIRDSLDNDIKVMVSTIEDQLLRVFDTYKDDMRDVVQKTTEWVRKNPELIDQLASMVDKFAGMALEMAKILDYVPKILNAFVIPPEASVLDNQIAAIESQIKTTIEMYNKESRTKDEIHKESVEKMKAREDEYIEELSFKRKVFAKIPFVAPEVMTRAERFNSIIADLTKTLTELKERRESLSATFFDFGGTGSEGLKDVGDEAKKTGEALYTLSKEAKAARDSLLGISIDTAFTDTDNWWGIDSIYNYEQAVIRVNETAREQINLTANEIYDTYDEEGEAYKKLKEDETKEAEKAHEKQLSDTEKSLKKQEDEYRHMYDNIHDINASMWRGFIDGGDNAFDIILDKAKSVFAEILATWSTQSIMNVAFGSDGSATGGSTISSLSNLKTLYGAKDYVGGLFGAGSGMGATGAGVGYSAYGVPAADAAAMGSVKGAGAGMGAGMTYAGVAAAAAYIVKSAWDLKKKMDADRPAVGFSYADPFEQQGMYGTEASQLDPSGLFRSYAVETGNNEVIREGIEIYFTSVFEQLDKSTNSALSEILKDLPKQSAMFFDMTGDFETDLAALSAHVYDTAKDAVLLDLFPDGGMTTKTILPKYNTPQPQRISFTGIDAFENAAGTGYGRDYNSGAYVGRDAEPVPGAYEEWLINPDLPEQTQQISAMAEKFNDAFFDAILPEGTRLDALIVFGDAIKNNEGFMESLTRQMDDFGETAIDAFLNLQTIDNILLDLSTATDATMYVSDVQIGLDFINDQFEELTATLTDAHATVEQLNTAQEAHTVLLGAAVTGLAGESVYNAINTGQDISGILAKNLWSGIASGLTSDVAEKYTAPLNKMMGEALNSGMDYADAIGMIPEWQTELGWDQMQIDLDAAKDDFNKSMGLIPEIIEEVAKDIKGLATLRNWQLGTSDLSVMGQKYGAQGDRWSNFDDAATQQNWIDWGKETKRGDIAAYLDPLGISITDFTNDMITLEGVLLESADAAQAVADAIKDERLGLESQLLQVQGDTTALRAIELESLDESNRALQERIWGLEDETAIADERLGLESDLLQVQSDTVALRQLDLDALDESNRALQESIWLLEDETAIANELISLENQLLQVQGDTVALRKLELESLNESNRSLQESIWAFEDAAMITDERLGLENQLLQAQGDTAAIRVLELDALDVSNRAIQERIYALEDAAEAEAKAAELSATKSDLEIQIMELEGNAAGALALTRQLELDALDDSLDPLQERIYALQDEAEAAKKAAEAAEALAESLAELGDIKQDIGDRIRSLTGADPLSGYANRDIGIGMDGSMGLQLLSGIIYDVLKPAMEVLQEEISHYGFDEFKGLTLEMPKWLEEDKTDPVGNDYWIDPTWDLSNPEQIYADYAFKYNKSLEDALKDPSFTAIEPEGGLLSLERFIEEMGGEKIIDQPEILAPLWSEGDIQEWFKGSFPINEIIDEFTGDWGGNIEDVRAQFQDLSNIMRQAAYQGDITNEEYESIMNTVLDDYEEFLTKITTLADGIIQYNTALDSDYLAPGALLVKALSTSGAELTTWAESIDIINASIMSDSDGLDDYAMALLGFSTAYTDLNTLLQAGNIAADEYNALFGETISLYQESVADIEAAKTTFEGFIDSINDYLDSLVDKSNVLDLSYERAKREYQSTLSAAIGGDTDAQGRLTSVADDFLTASEKYNSTQYGYQKDIGIVRRSMAGMVEETEDQVDVMDEILEEAKIQTLDLEDLNSAMYDNSDTLAAIDGLLEEIHIDESEQWADLFEDYLGDNSLVAELLKGLAKPPAGETPPTGETPGGGSLNTGRGSLGLFTYDGAYPDWVVAAGVQNAYDYVNRGSMGMNDQFRAPDDTLKTMADIMDEYYGFANGGIASGPTSGYPVTLHGTEAIIPINGGASIPVTVNNSALEREIKSLRDDLQAANLEIIKTNKKMLKILDRVTQGKTTVRTTEVAA